MKKLREPALALALLLLSTALWAQGTAQISGVVKDESGAVLPGVTVTVTQVDTGLIRTVATETNGAYTMPNLPTGPYRLVRRNEDVADDQCRGEMADEGRKERGTGFERGPIEDGPQHLTRPSARGGSGWCRPSGGYDRGAYWRRSSVHNACRARCRRTFTAVAVMSSFSAVSCVENSSMSRSISTTR